MIRTLEALQRCAEMLDSIGRTRVPICIYDMHLYAAHDDFGSATYGAHPLIYMSPQGAPPNPKRTYVNDVQEVPAQKKLVRTKWSKHATKASSLF